MKGTFVFVLILCGVLFALAFPATNIRWQQGLEAYETAGTIVILILMGTPFLAHPSLPLWQRVLLSAGLAILGILVWFGGIAAAGFGLLGPIRVM